MLSEVSESDDEVTARFANYDARNWDIPQQQVISQVGLSSVLSCACVTDFASPQRPPILMQLICSVVSPVSTCTCVRLSVLLHTLVHARTFFQIRVACDLSNVFSRSDLGPDCTQVLNSQRENLVASRKSSIHSCTSFCGVVVVSCLRLERPVDLRH